MTRPVGRTILYSTTVDSSLLPIVKARTRSQLAWSCDCLRLVQTSSNLGFFRSCASSHSNPGSYFSSATHTNFPNMDVADPVQMRHPAVQSVFTRDSLSSCDSSRAFTRSPSVLCSFWVFLRTSCDSSQVRRPLRQVISPVTIPMSIENSREEVNPFRSATRSGSVSFMNSEYFMSVVTTATILPDSFGIGKKALTNVPLSFSIGVESKVGFFDLNASLSLSLAFP